VASCPLTVPRRSALVYRALEFLASAELRNLGGADLDGVAGARVAARTRGAASDRECSETHERHALTLAQRRSDCAEHAIDCPLCGGLGDVCSLGDCFDQLG